MGLRDFDFQLKFQLIVVQWQEDITSSTWGHTISTLKEQLTRDWKSE